MIWDANGGDSGAVLIHSLTTINYLHDTAQALLTARWHSSKVLVPR